MRQLPPLNALRAFEAAARHMSFSKAADELNVTPAAISQQIRALEDIVGVKLFRRLTRALLLTDAGRVALPALTAGLDLLAEGYSDMRRQEDAGALTISVAPSLAAKWLVPRLEGFRALHPQFDIRIDATDRLADFQRGDVDVALRYGDGQYDGMEVRCLMSELSAPVCSPALLEGAHPLRKPTDLRHHTLLHSQWRMQHAFAPNWRMWLKASGLGDIDPNTGPASAKILWSRRPPLPGKVWRWSGRLSLPQTCGRGCWCIRSEPRQTCARTIAIMSSTRKRMRHAQGAGICGLGS